MRILNAFLEISRTEVIARMARRATYTCAALAVLAGCSSGANAPSLTPQQVSAPNGISPDARTEAGAAAVPNANMRQSISHYYMIPLGTLGGTKSVANSIDNRGFISGISTLAGDAATHATLWLGGQKIDLGTLGGPDSGVGWPVKNELGQIVGFSDVAQTDPLAENFCGTGSSHLCAGFSWKYNLLTPLSTLGGNNSFAAGVNDAGQIVGFAETAAHDSTCAAPQALDYYGTIWNRNGKARALQPFPGDGVSQAVAINNAGAAVGASGPCGPPNNNGDGTAHALLWGDAAAPINLGTLGGTTANIATAINDRGDVVGQSATSGNLAYHAFRWRDGTMHDLGTLPGDTYSEALGLNNDHQATGYSCDAAFNCRGFVWQNGSMTDLNLLVQPSQLYITYAGDINDRGWIVGQAVDMKTGRAPAVLLIPANGIFRVNAGAAKIILPENVRRQFQAHHGFRPIIE